MKQHLMPCLQPFYSKILRTASVLETPQDGYCVAVSINTFNKYVDELR